MVSMLISLIRFLLLSKRLISHLVESVAQAASRAKVNQRTDPVGKEHKDHPESLRPFLYSPVQCTVNEHPNPEGRTYCHHQQNTQDDNFWRTHNEQTFPICFLASI